MEFIYIANDPSHIRIAEMAGVDRLMIDLEINGKEGRQGHLDTVISRHSLDDVRAARKLLKNTRLMVRVNPLFSGSSREIDDVVNAGAQIVMLPMFTRPQEVESFVSMVGGRAKVSLLLETPQALARLDQVLRLGGIDEVHVGLNDLHLGLGLEFMFEALAGGLVEFVASRCKEREIQFGFGGVARLGSGQLPADQILAAHARLGSRQVILSRDFRTLFAGSDNEVELASQLRVEVDKLRAQMARLAEWSRERLLAEHEALVRNVGSITQRRAVDQPIRSRHDC